MRTGSISAASHGMMPAGDDLLEAGKSIKNPGLLFEKLAMRKYTGRLIN